jgi:dolichyl-phosphate-mannose-protein mannosyltransferase
MASASPAPGLRQRGGKRAGDGVSPSPVPESKASIVPPKQAVRKAAGAASKQSDWDYKLAFVVITALAFATRFYRISHPDEVVFDEVHFGKVRVFLCLGWPLYRHGARS